MTQFLGHTSSRAQSQRRQTYDHIGLERKKKVSELAFENFGNFEGSMIDEERCDCMARVAIEWTDGKFEEGAVGESCGEAVLIRCGSDGGIGMQNVLPCNTLAS